MEIKVRYEGFDQFFRLNKEDFQRVQAARKQMKSIQELGMTGNAIAESEKLAYSYLNLRNLVSDLLFGVAASVLDAKHDIKTQNAIVFREMTGAQGTKTTLLEADPRVISAHKKYNDLLDLELYLKNKYSDFESCHYYYKQLAQGNK